MRFTSAASTVERSAMEDLSVRAWLCVLGCMCLAACAWMYVLDCACCVRSCGTWRSAVDVCRL